MRRISHVTGEVPEGSPILIEVVTTTKVVGPERDGGQQAWSQVGNGGQVIGLFLRMRSVLEIC